MFARCFLETLARVILYPNAGASQTNPTQTLPRFTGEGQGGDNKRGVATAPPLFFPLTMTL